MPSGRVTRFATYVVFASTAWFGLALTWGLFGPIGGGHGAIVASRGIIADNMMTWGIWGPVREYTLDRPTPSLYYVHHPWGTYWLIGALMKVFGRHPFVPRLEAIVMSVACPPLLYGIGRALWGPVAGALAALAYVVLPIALAFGNFPGFEGALIFGCLLTTWGYLRFQDRWKRRWMAVSLAGVVFSVNADWEACVFLGAVLGTLLVTGLFLPQWFAPVNARRFGQWWSMAVIITTLTVFGYLVYIKHIGKVDDFLQGEAKRETGNDVALSVVLRARQYWIDLLFTPLAIAIGKLALPILLFRLVILRRHLEIFPLALLLMATLEYVHFRNGADTHTYWPHPFAPYWALSLGVVGQTALDIARFAVRRLEASHFRGEVPADFIALGVLGAIAILPLMILPDGIRALAYARATGGRFDDRGRRIFQGLDEAAACEWMSAQMAPNTQVLIHPSLHAAWAVNWALRRPTVGIDTIPGPSQNDVNRYFVANLAFVTPSDQARLGSQFHLVVVGPYVLVDRAAPIAPAEGYSFEVREPSRLEWYFAGGVDPIRTVKPDPWYTWELRDHFGQAPDPAPPSPPETLEELRIAHNAAIAVNDLTRAEELQKRLTSKLDGGTARFTDGTLFLGEHFAKGVAPVLDVYLLASGPSATEDAQFDIRSIVDRRPPFSLVEADSRIKAVAMPLTIPPKLWKPGFIYASHSEIRQRPGRETYSGFFAGGRDASRPRNVDGKDYVHLLTLP